MIRFKWNIGIMIIRLGYKISTKTYGLQAINKDRSLRSYISKKLLDFGYSFRGEIPQKTWKWNHV